jgi:hypothetical protein
MNANGDGRDIGSVPCPPEPEEPPERSVRETLVLLGRTLGLRWSLVLTAISLFALLAVPVTIAGAGWHVHWLLVTGIAMLVLLVLSNAVLLPAPRIWHGRASS